MVCCLPLARLSLRDFCWSLKVMLPTPRFKRHFLPAVRIAVLFHTSGQHNIPLTTDEEQPESTNVIRSIPLTFTFITGSTSNGYRRRNWTWRHEFKSWTECISHCTNTLGKGMNPIILPPAMGK